MPTKIVAEESNPARGLINQQDVIQIIQDFDNLVNIVSTTAREFTKINTVSIPMSIVKHLIERGTNSDTMRLKIKFGITLPNAKDCLDGVTDVSDHLTALLILEENGIEKYGVNDFVIVPGFKEFDEFGAADSVCCPVIDPAHPGGH